MERLRFNAEVHGKIDMRASASLSSHAASRASRMPSQASPRSYEIFNYTPGGKAAELCFSLIYEASFAVLVAVAIVVARLPLLMQHACLNTF